MLVFEKNLDELKKELLSKLRDITHNTLSKTDWVIVKCNELNMNPADKYGPIVGYRQKVRDWCNEMESKINNSKTKEELYSLDITPPKEESYATNSKTQT